eukprot:3735396-Pyramimonas_sp.AAC.1
MTGPTPGDRGGGGRRGPLAAGATDRRSTRGAYMHMLPLPLQACGEQSGGQSCETRRHIPGVMTNRMRCMFSGLHTHAGAPPTRVVVPSALHAHKAAQPACAARFTHIPQLPLHDQRPIHAVGSPTCTLAQRPVGVHPVHPDWSKPLNKFPPGQQEMA